MKKTTQETDIKPGQSIRLALRDLFPHPLLDRIGVLPDMIEREARKGRQSGSNREHHKERAQELSGEFTALVADIAERGIQETLKVSRGLTNWLIADGRNRWLAFEAAMESDPDVAKRLEAEGIPCLVIDEEDVPAVILSAMTRRHMTKQARALMAIRVFPGIAEEASKGRQMGNDYPFKDQSELALRLGVSLETVKDACLFWRKLKLITKADLRDEAMQQVFAGISFHNVEVGLPSAIKKGQPKQNPKPRVWSLMMRNANSVKERWKDFEALEDEDRKLEIIEKLSNALAAAPADVKPALRAALEGRDA